MKNLSLSQLECPGPGQPHPQPQPHYTRRKSHLLCESCQQPPQRQKAPRRAHGSCSSRTRSPGALRGFKLCHTRPLISNGCFWSKSVANSSFLQVPWCLLPGLPTDQATEHSTGPALRAYALLSGGLKDGPTPAFSRVQNPQPSCAELFHISLVLVQEQLRRQSPTFQERVWFCRTSMGKDSCCKAPG